MTDYIDVGGTPAEEDCVGVSKTVDYVPAMRKEVQRWCDLLRTCFPEAEFNKIQFVRRSNPHDFGTYYTAAVRFDENDEQSCRQAYFVDEQLPVRWSDKAVRTMVQTAAPATGILAAIAAEGGDA